MLRGRGQRSRAPSHLDPCGRRASAADLRARPIWVQVLPPDAKPDGGTVSARKPAPRFSLCRCSITPGRNCQESGGQGHPSSPTGPAQQPCSPCKDTPCPCLIPSSAKPGEMGDHIRRTVFGRLPCARVDCTKRRGQIASRRSAVLNPVPGLPARLTGLPIAHSPHLLPARRPLAGNRSHNARTQRTVAQDAHISGKLTRPRRYPPDPTLTKSRPAQSAGAVSRSGRPSALQSAFGSVDERD